MRDFSHQLITIILFNLFLFITAQNGGDIVAFGNGDFSGNVENAGDLIVQGLSTFEQGAVLLEQTTMCDADVNKNLLVGGSVEIDGELDVFDLATFNNDIILGSDSGGRILGTDSIEIRGGDSTTGGYGGDILISSGSGSMGAICPPGTPQTGSTVTITAPDGEINIGSSTDIINIGNSGSTTTFFGDVLFNGPTSFLDGIDITGLVEFNNDLIVGGTLEVDGESTFNTLIVNNEITSDDASVTGTLTVSGSATFRSIDTNNVNTSTLQVSNYATFGFLDVSGSFTGVNGFFQDITSTNIESGTMNVQQTLSVGNITVIDSIIAKVGTFTDSIYANSTSFTIGNIGNITTSSFQGISGNINDISINDGNFINLIVSGQAQTNELNAVTVDISDTFSTTYLEIEGELEVLGRITTESLENNRDLTTLSFDTQHLYIDGILQAGNADAFLGNTETESLLVSQNLEVSSSSLFVGEVNMYGSLSIEGDATFLGSVSITSLSGESAFIQNSLNVNDLTGISAIFSDDVDVKGILRVQCEAIAENVRTENLEAESAEITQINTGDLNVLDDLLVSGNSELQGSVSIDGELSVGLDLRVEGSSDFLSDVTIYASANIRESLTVEGNAYLDALEVIGVSNFSGIINSCKTSTETLDVSGSSLLNDVEILGNVDLSGGLNVDGTVLLEGSTTVTSLFGHEGIFDWLFADNIYTDNAIVTDLTADNGVINDITVLHEAFTENINVDGTFNAVNGNFEGELDVSSINVAGEAFLNSLSVFGSSTFGDVSGDSVNVFGDINAHGHIYASGDIDIDGDAILGGLTVQGLSTFNDGMDVVGDVNVFGIITAASFGISGELFASDIETNTLSVTGGVVVGSFTSGGNVLVHGSTAIDGYLTVEGTTVLGATSINGYLQVSDSLSADSLNIQRDIIVSGNIITQSVSADEIQSNSLDVENINTVNLETIILTADTVNANELDASCTAILGAAFINNDLNVAGSGTFSSISTNILTSTIDAFFNDLTVNGTVNVGDITAQSGNFVSINANQLNTDILESLNIITDNLVVTHDAIMESFTSDYASIKQIIIGGDASINGSVNINNDLVVSGTLNVDTLNAGEIEGDLIGITGDITFDGDLDVRGKLTIGELETCGDLDTDTLYVSESIFVSSLAVLGSIISDSFFANTGNFQTLQITDNLNVNTINTVDIAATQITINGNFVVNGDSLFGGLIQVENIDVGGESTFTSLTSNSIVSTTSRITTLTSSTTTISNGDFTTLDVSANAIVHDLFVSGHGIFGGPDPTTISGNLEVNGNALFTLDVTTTQITGSDADFSGTILANSTTFNNVESDIIDIGNQLETSSLIADNIDVNGNVTFGANVEVCKDVNIAGDLISRTGSFIDVFIQDDLTVGDTITSTNIIASDVTVTNLLSAENIGSQSGSFHILDVSSLQAIDFTSNSLETVILQVSNDGSIGGSLTVLGNTKVEGTLIAEGNVILGSDGILTQTEILGNAVLENTLDVIGDISGQGSLLIDELANFAGGLIVGGNLEVDGDAIISNSLSVGGDITVIGDFTSQNGVFNQNLVSLSLTTNDAIIQNSLVAITITATDINVSDDITATLGSFNSIIVGGNGNFGSLSVSNVLSSAFIDISGDSTFAGSVTIGLDLTSNSISSNNANIANQLSASTAIFNSLTVSTTLNGDTGIFNILNIIGSVSSDTLQTDILTAEDTITQDLIVNGNTVAASIAALTGQFLGDVEANNLNVLLDTIINGNLVVLGSSSFTGGNVFIGDENTDATISMPDGQGYDLIISSQNSPTGSGGDIEIIAGDSNTTCTGGDIILQGGDGEVNGVVQIYSDTFIDGNLFVDGTFIGTDANLLGDLTLGSSGIDFTITRGRNINGDGADLIINGQDGSSVSNGGDIIITAGLGGNIILGDSNTQNILNGDTTISGILDVTQQVTIQSNLIVNSDTIINGNIFVGQDTSSETLSVSGNAAINGESLSLGSSSSSDFFITRGSVSGDAGDLSIIGQTGNNGGDVSIIGGTGFDIGGDIILNGGGCSSASCLPGSIFIGTTCQAVHIWNAEMTGDTSFDSNLDISGNILFGEQSTIATISFTGNSTDDGTPLFIRGQDSNLNGGDIVLNAGQGNIEDGEIFIATNGGDVNIASPDHITNILGLLNVRSDTNIAGDLFVSGESFLEGDITLGSSNGPDFIITRPSVNGAAFDTNFIGQSGIDGGNVLIEAGLASNGRGGDLELFGGSGTTQGGDIFIDAGCSANGTEGGVISIGGDCTSEVIFNAPVLFSEDVFVTDIDAKNAVINDLTAITATISDITVTGLLLVDDISISSLFSPTDLIVDNLNITHSITGTSAVFDILEVDILEVSCDGFASFGGDLDVEVGFTATNGNFTQDLLVNGDFIVADRFIALDDDNTPITFLTDVDIEGIFTVDGEYDISGSATIGGHMLVGQAANGWVMNRPCNGVGFPTQFIGQEGLSGNGGSFDIFGGSSIEGVGGALNFIGGAGQTGGDIRVEGGSGENGCGGSVFIDGQLVNIGREDGDINIGNCGSSTRVLSDFFVDGTSQFTGDVEMTSSLTVMGITTLTEAVISYLSVENLIVQGNADFNIGITVNGASSFNTISVTGLLTANTLDVSSLVADTADFVDASISNTLSVGESIDVTGSANFFGDASLGNVQAESFISAGIFTVDGESSFNGPVSFFAPVSVNGADLTVSGGLIADNIDIDGTLTVSGTANINILNAGTIVKRGENSVTGANFNGRVTFSGACGFDPIFKTLGPSNNFNFNSPPRSLPLDEPGTMFYLELEEDSTRDSPLIAEASSIPNEEKPSMAQRINIHRIGGSDDDYCIGDMIYLVGPISEENEFVRLISVDNDLGVTTSNIKFDCDYIKLGNRGIPAIQLLRVGNIADEITWSIVGGVSCPE